MKKKKQPLIFYLLMLGVGVIFICFGVGKIFVGDFIFVIPTIFGMLFVYNGSRRISEKVKGVK